MGAFLFEGLNTELVAVFDLTGAVFVGVFGANRFTAAALVFSLFSDTTEVGGFGALHFFGDWIVDSLTIALI